MAILFWIADSILITKKHVIISRYRLNLLHVIKQAEQNKRAL